MPKRCRWPCWHWWESTYRQRPAVHGTASDMKVFLGGNLFHFHEAQIELVHLSVWLQAFYIQYMYLYTPLLISHHFALSMVNSLRNPQPCKAHGQKWTSPFPWPRWGRIAVRLLWPKPAKTGAARYGYHGKNHGKKPWFNHQSWGFKHEQ